MRRLRTCEQPFQGALDGIVGGTDWTVLRNHSGRILVRAVERHIVYAPKPRFIGSLVIPHRDQHDSDQEPNDESTFPPPSGLHTLTPRLAAAHARHPLHSHRFPYRPVDS